MLKRVWVDLETTGLHPQNCTILQVGILVTEGEDLREIDALEVSISPPHRDSIQWQQGALAMHEISGLLAHCKAQGLNSLDDAVAPLLAFMDRHFDAATPRPLLGGQSVHFDRAFLALWLPELHQRFYYQHLDATSVFKMLQTVLGADVCQTPAQRPHTALADLRLMLTQLRRVSQALRTLGADALALLV